MELSSCVCDGLSLDDGMIATMSGVLQEDLPVLSFKDLSSGGITADNTGGVALVHHHHNLSIVGGLGVVDSVISGYTIQPGDNEKPARFLDWSDSPVDPLSLDDSINAGARMMQLVNTNDLDSANSLLRHSFTDQCSFPLVHCNSDYAILLPLNKVNVIAKCEKDQAPAPKSRTVLPPDFLSGIGDPTVGGTSEAEPMEVDHINTSMGSHIFLANDISYKSINHNEGRNVNNCKQVESVICLPSNDLSVAMEHGFNEPIEPLSFMPVKSEHPVDKELNLGRARQVIVKKKKLGIQEITVRPGKDIVRVIYVPRHILDAPHEKLVSNTVGATKGRRYRLKHGGNRNRINDNVAILEAYRRRVFPFFSTEACLDQTRINALAAVELRDTTKTGSSKSAQQTRVRRKQKDQELVKMCRELVNFFNVQLQNGHEFPGDVFNIITCKLAIEI